MKWALANFHTVKFVVSPNADQRITLTLLQKGKEKKNLHGNDFMQNENKWNYAKYCKIKVSS